MIATIVLCSPAGTGAGNWHQEEATSLQYVKCICHLAENADFVAFSYVYFACQMTLLSSFTNFRGNCKMLTEWAVYIWHLRGFLLA